MIDQIILVIFGVLVLMAILGKLIKPVLWLIISIYLINQFTLYVFDAYIFGVLYAYFF